MDLLDIALRFTEQIPETDAYRDEREFCWLAVGKAALAMERPDLVGRALGELAGRRGEAELRFRSLGSPRFRDQALSNLLERWPAVQPLLWRVEAYPVAILLFWRYGFDALLAQVEAITDPYNRSDSLRELCLFTPDRDLRRHILRSDLDAVSGLPDDTRQDCLEEIAAGFNNACDPDAAIAVARQIKDGKYSTGIREDLIEEAERIRQEGGELALSEFIDTPSPDAFWAMANTQLEKPFEFLRGDEPQVFAEALELIAAGQTDEGGVLLQAGFPTRFQPASLSLPQAERDQFLLWQLQNTSAYPRNDVRVEYLAELAAGLASADIEPPPKVVEAASESSFIALQPAPIPYFTDRDPSRMTADELARFLFDRPRVPDDDDAERILNREYRGTSDWEYQLDKAKWLRLLTEFFTGFGPYAAHYSVEQVDQGLWAIWGPYSFEFVLTDDEVPLEIAADCVDASLAIYRDYVRFHRISEDCSSFLMFWDTIWPHPASARDVALKKRLFHVLEQVLWMEHPECQSAALNGLVRLHPMPAVSELVARFIEQGEPANDDIGRFARHVVDWPDHNPDAWRLQPHLLL